MTTFLCQGIFSTFQKIKLVFLIVHLLFVTFKTNSGISHRWIIKSCIPAHNYNLNHLALSAAKCNPGSRKTVEHPLESCTSSFICFISMYVLKARILDLILKPPPQPFVYHFWQRRYTFCIPSIEKWCTLHIPSREIYIPFNWCKCTVYLNKPQNQTAVSRPFHSHKMRHLVLLGHFTNQNDKFPNPYIYFNYWIPCPFHIPGHWKRGFSPYRQLYLPPPARAFSQALDILVFYF